MKLLIKIILFVLLTLLLNTFAFASDSVGLKKVLMLYSNKNPMSYSDLVDQGIHSALESSEIDKFEYYIEYMDKTRFSDKLYAQSQLDFYRQKYSGIKIDLIIAVSIHAIDFILMYGDEIFPGIPVVFCSVGKRRVENLSYGPNVTGSSVENDFVGTLDVALQLHPDTRRVVVVGGAGNIERYWETVARKEFRGYEDEIEFIYLTGLPMNNLLEKVANQPAHTIIIYSFFLVDGAGRSFDGNEAVSLISRASNAPVYSQIGSYMGQGVVGGNMTNSELQGEVAGEIGLRILSGEKPSDIPVSSGGTNTYMFDWRQLKRWGISESDLPPGSNVRYKDLSVWETYKWLIIGAFILFLIEALLIVVLLLNRSKRRQAEESLQIANDELKKRVGELSSAQEQIIRSERLAATGQLAASVAHEINSPLQAITMLLGTMRRENEENKELLDNINLLKGSFYNIRDTVKNLMDLNRPGKERKQMMNVNTITKNTAALMKSHLKKNKVKIDLNLSSDVPDMIASPQQLGHVFLNLINNAVEAMSGVSKSEAKWKERSKVGGDISIKTMLERDSIIIQVSDTGLGIAEEDLEHIFDPFYTRKKTMGTGVGLSICNGIIEDHNGTIEAKNAEDGGAVFTVTLPLKTSVMKVS